VSRVAACLATSAVLVSACGERWEDTHSPGALYYLEQLEGVPLPADQHREIFVSDFQRYGFSGPELQCSLMRTPCSEMAVQRLDGLNKQLSDGAKFRFDESSQEYRLVSGETVVARFGLDINSLAE
jgi:hypothetical protein